VAAQLASHCALRIDGRGASIVVISPTAGLFNTSNMHGSSTGNSTVDYDPLPMTQEG
jgi:hypothetical protein